MKSRTRKSKLAKSLMDPTSEDIIHQTDTFLKEGGKINYIEKGVTNYTYNNSPYSPKNRQAR